MHPVRLVASLVASSALAIAGGTVMVEQPVKLPQGWSLHGPAGGSDTVQLYVALNQPGIAELKDQLLRNVESRKRGADDTMSQQQVKNFRKPAPLAATTVLAWLEGNGATNVQQYDSWIGFEVSVAAAQTMFEAQLAYYAYGDTSPVLRTLSYTVPWWLEIYIDFVFPLMHWLPPRQPQPLPGYPWPSPSSTSRPPKTTSTLITTSTRKPTSTSTSTSKSTSISKSKSTSKATSSSKPVHTSKTTSSSQPTSTPGSPGDGSGSDGNGSGSDPGSGAFLPCATGTFPDCIKQLYNISLDAITAVVIGSPSPPASAPLVRLGIAGFLEQWINYADVADFMRMYAPSLPRDYNFTIALLNGGEDPQTPLSSAGMEASLDVEYALALAYPANVTYYSTGGRGTKLDVNGTAVPPTSADNEPYLEFLQALLAMADSDLPHVLSISYADDEQSVPQAYASRVCDLFAQLTARGVSVLVATGDHGAAGTGQGGNTQCFANDGSGKKVLMPTFPASCPYVTAVGAVDNVAPPVIGASFSAGGFSNYFARPAWQDAAVAPYVDSLVQAGGPKIGMFNESGRATPDVSVVGGGFNIQYKGVGGYVLGTSASTPVFAAMIALVNEARLQEGKSSLGWLNPLLYSSSVQDAINDVVGGVSESCYYDDGLVTGWEAVAGFDCVTGVGNIKAFDKLVQVLA